MLLVLPGRIGERRVVAGGRIGWFWRVPPEPLIAWFWILAGSSCLGGLVAWLSREFPLRGVPGNRRGGTAVQVSHVVAEGGVDRKTHVPERG